MTQRPLALITGASSGIGAAFANVMAADGYDLVLVARREDRLEALKAELSTSVTTLPLDITQENAGATLAERVETLGRPVSVLVNNAGLGAAGPFLSRESAEQTQMVDLNMRALVDLSHRFLPQMVEAGGGGLINIASTAAYQPGPRMAVYYASKAFVLSFSEALWEEMRRHGVTVTAVCPGPTASEFGAVAGMDKVRVFKYATKMTAQDVAKVGYAGFRARKRVVVCGFQNKLTMAAASVVPNRILLPVVRRLQSPG